MEPEGCNTQNDNSFTQVGFACLFSVEFLWKFLSLVWQHSCCSSYCCRDMRGPKVLLDERLT